MILTIYEGVCFGARNVDEKVCIRDTSLRKYMPTYIKPMININNITCGWETCISAMLLQSYINTEGYNNGKNLISYILILNQLDFYKYPRIISLNKIIKYFQIIHVYI